MRYPKPKEPELAKAQLEKRLTRLHEQVIVGICLVLCVGLFLKIVLL